MCIEKKDTRIIKEAIHIQYALNGLIPFRLFLNFNIIQCKIKSITKSQTNTEFLLKSMNIKTDFTRIIDLIHSTKLRI
jgi:hypothetical protein